MAYRRPARRTLLVGCIECDAEVVPVSIAQKKGEAVILSQDEHPRDTRLEALARLKGVVQQEGAVTVSISCGHNGGEPTSCHRWPLCVADDVHRRGPGHCCRA